MVEIEPRIIRFCRHANATVLCIFGLYFFLMPGATVISELADPDIRGGGIPDAAWRLHRALTPKFEEWAMQRLESNRATELSVNDISGTEWPLFGSVFYLWATESLQESWEINQQLSATAPKVYAKGAIEAATRLVIDPDQANWVMLHWGEDYLKRENVFYRMLVISALTSHARLTAETQHLPLLREQVESLSAELDASPHGLLDDYPGECYPGDVLTAIAMIQKADSVLGTDHSAFVERAIRGFEGKALDPRGMVPYSAIAARGEPSSPTRGCGNSYVSLFSPLIWPKQATNWYELYVKYFWQETWGCAGFREFPNNMPGHEWYMDVDAGPVWKGFGCAACAFGAGAARINGHFEHAYPLTAQMLVTTWPLPNGTRFLPRLLSNATDAPYLGEAAILFNLTRRPVNTSAVTTGGSMPAFVVIFLTLQLGFGLTLVVLPIRSILRRRKNLTSFSIPAPHVQFAIWIGLIVAAFNSLLLNNGWITALLLLCAQFLPRYRKRRSVPPATHPADLAEAAK